MIPPAAVARRMRREPPPHPLERLVVLALAALVAAGTYEALYRGWIP